MYCKVEQRSRRRVWAAPHNSKYRCGERGAWPAKRKAQAILGGLPSIFSTLAMCRSRRSGALGVSRELCGDATVELDSAGDLSETPLGVGQGSRMAHHKNCPRQRGGNFNKKGHPRLESPAMAGGRHRSLSKPGCPAGAPAAGRTPIKPQRRGRLCSQPFAPAFPLPSACRRVTENTVRYIFW